MAKQAQPDDLAAKITPHINAETMTAVRNALRQNAIFANPDDLAGKRKEGFEIYRQMGRDPDVKAALSQLLSRIIEPNYTIEPGGEDQIDAEAAAFVDWNLKVFADSEFDELRGMAQAYVDGSSIGEPIYEEIPDGQYKGKLRLKDIKWKDVLNFEVTVDAFENVVSLKNKIDNKIIDPSGIIRFVHNRIFENPHGRSELYAALRYFQAKEATEKLRLAWLEFYSHGAKLIFKHGQLNTPQLTTLKTAFSEWITRSGIIIPKDIDIETVTASGDGEAYRNAISDYGRQILLSIIGSFMSVQEGTNTGARALGEVHSDGVDRIAALFRASLIRQWNRQVIEPLAKINFALEGRMPPRFVMGVIDLDQLKAELDIDSKLFEMGVPLSAKELRKRYHRAMPIDEADTIVKKAPADPFGGGAPLAFAENRDPDPARKQDMVIDKVADDFNNIITGIFDAVSEVATHTVKKN